MKRLIALIGMLLMSNTFTQAADRPLIDLDFGVRSLNGDDLVNLKQQYAGKVILVVNTASKCGFTNQYEALEQMYDSQKQNGLAVLGFPSNDFRQEQGTEKEIQDFCRLTYGIKFPMFKKTSVKEGSADLLYQRLGEAAGEYPAWNFHKYLIDRDGRLVGSYSSSTKPDEGKLYDAILALL